MQYRLSQKFKIMEGSFYNVLILAIPVASIAWTVTKEEIFREPRTYCINKSKDCTHIFQRKFFYVFTCEYCFSHYITALVLFFTKSTLLYNDWRGYIIAGFSIVFMANVYMSLFNLIRIDLKKGKTIIAKEELKMKRD